jgi:hypothetical protein
MAVNMTAYPSVRKPALDAPEPIELEFAKDRPDEQGNADRSGGLEGQGGDRVAAAHPRLCRYREEPWGRPSRSRSRWLVTTRVTPGTSRAICRAR